MTRQLTAPGPGRETLRGTAGHASARDESGTAAIEFIFASVVLLVPVVYIVIAISTLQAGTYATQAIAIDAARYASRHPDTAHARANATASLHLDDFGLTGTPHRVKFSCSEKCDTPGSTVTAHVETRVALPGIPFVFNSDTAGRITVTASHTDIVAPTGGHHDITHGITGSP
ncbi:hypothetical protein HMPREF0183_0919 [Brevibacterium mcbrellneri ATCC 49030]|uniref:TadE-like protein n=1 Tax=Brevibacterium mcbrellneri ATCC 49030 TaxID=585530 RepID=D4YLV9_9MICO|nr:hypothetical protein [Brevibacterium mcbrellneri]EFG47842.1 hypothetical protein HMPREF0183_0919 [Brevibacterium mcbrellneri ATCC 49030]